MENKVLQQLKAQDAAFLYMETKDNLTHVTGFGIYDPSTAPDGHVRFKDIIAHMRSRLHTSPIFKRRLVHVPFELDYPYWADDPNFDLEYHIRHAGLPKPADWRQLCIHMARYHSRPLDMNRPPWEMYVLEGLDNVEGVPPGSFAVVTKIHHVAVDGASAMRFFAAITDSDANGTPAIDISSIETPLCNEPGLPRIFGRAVVNNMTSPVRMANTIIRSSPIIVGMVKKALEKGENEVSGVPDTRFNVNVSSHKMYDGTKFSLGDFKEIRQLVPGATINDVVLAICAGGLRRYLEAHDELPEEPLVAWVPINARIKGKSGDASGNNITAMTAAIHTDIADPVARLKAIKETTQQTKEAKSGVSARLMTDISQHVPSATQVLAARLITRVGTGARVCNLFVSNVPGPQVPMYMAGAKQVSNYAMAPLNNGMGLFIATPSYNGIITFGVTTTREIMPDIAFFVGCLNEAFDELKKATKGIKPSIRKKTSSRKKSKKAKKVPKSRVTQTGGMRSAS
ncbi:MAG: wax ester/triacylglycerol synthase family O-acyltransferase [Gammaproteobacteria bacterium]|nr:wax ester/triacylglycerol synthase family O-acyltransferase [Gammaproteobacteria bacterium]